MKKAAFLIVALTLVLIEANENKLKIGIKKRVWRRRYYKMPKIIKIYCRLKIVNKKAETEICYM